MKTIYKYTLPSDGEIINLPAGAEILSGKAQRGHKVIYAMVDTLAGGVEPYEFISVPTGAYANHTIGFTFLNTVMFSSNQSYVEHIFYRKL